VEWYIASAWSCINFEKLRGNLEGFCSVRINKQWRLIFRWSEAQGEADDLYLDDHSYM
jgi:toxin HigB-1